MVFGLCLVGVVLFVLLGWFLCCFPLFFVSAWWNRGIADEVTIASFCKAVTGAAVMARSANEEKKSSTPRVSGPSLPWIDVNDELEWPGGPPKYDPFDRPRSRSPRTN